MTFERWIYEVSLYWSVRLKIDITEVYSSIDLTDAKLAFIDGILPNEYNL